MTLLCNELNGINMAQGLCDLDVPREVLEGAQNALIQGENSYTSSYGISELRSAIAMKQNSFHSLDIKEENVLVSTGATGAFYTTAKILLHPGDEVIVFEPYYGYHVSTLQSLGCKVKFISTTPPEYSIDFNKLENLISEKTKAILICNPSNPSGKVYTKAELESLGKLVKQYHLILFSDEMYEHFVYDDTTFVSALSINSLKNNVVVVSGFSKIYSVTGWRVGYAITSAEIIEAASHINDLIYLCPPAPLQHGVLNGLKNLPLSYYKNVAVEHQKKRDKLVKTLNDSGLKADSIKGAYYILADISKIEGATTTEKAINLLNKTGIATVPGKAFYHATSDMHLVRFCFSKKEKELDEACRRLRELI
jgi:aminotransferase